MKKQLKLIVMMAVAVTFFMSCEKDDPIPEQLEPKVSYILNYGDYTGGKSTITAFDKETGTATNNFYESVNGVAMVSNVQHAVSAHGKIYFLGNSADQIFWVDGETFEQTENGISDEIIKPRYGVVTGSFLYVSCWGGDIWADENTSYIAKINLSSKTIEKKITLPGGPEGMALANNKLFAALNYKDSVAVVDLANDAISYIETPAVTSYFVKDNSENLYVSLVSTFSDFSETTGLGYINTATNQFENVYELEGVSTSYVNILSTNNDFSKLYVMTSAYDANWNLSGAVAVFDVATKTFETENLVEGISGLNGVAYYNNKVFTFISETVTGNGKAQIYSPDGVLETEFETGIAPYMLLTVKD